MHLNADISSALQQIEAVKKGIDDSDDPKLQMQTSESLKTILDILHDPVFRTIVHVQDSLSELNAQLTQHPSMLPNDFDIDVAGNLVLSINGCGVAYEFDERQSSSLVSPHSGPSSPGSGAGAMASGVTGEPDDLSRPQSQNSKTAAFVDLFSAEYAQIQAIELVNDGTGLGFGIIGARTSGVIVKTILAGGVADRDGRLRSGDHILQIGSVNLHEMGSEQVAAVLRQSGTHVRLVVARPVDPSIQTTPYDLEPNSVIVPVRFLSDPAELERYLISVGYPEIFGESSTASTPQTTTEDERFDYRMDNLGQPRMAHGINLDELLDLPETETLQVELKKDSQGLGITIAGYVCEKEELSGIFIKSVSPGSAADLSGRIRVNDRIIEVDGQSLQGFSNHQAVELLKKSGQVVNLRLERYLRGPKYEQLQQAIAANDKMPSVPSTPLRNTQPSPIATTSASSQRSSVATVSKITNLSAEDASDISGGDLEAVAPPPPPFSTAPIIISSADTNLLTTFASAKKLITVRDSLDGSTKIITNESTDADEIPYGQTSLSVELTPEDEQVIIKKWQKIVGSDMEIIIAQIKKFAGGGLGISLEGTVDVEGGREVRPHHYIRSILADGPVGVNGVLRSGDELLEVNGQRLLGINHLEVVAILKDLPLNVRMVVGRGKNALMPFSDDTLKKLSSNFENLLPTTDRLVKAKSDGSLATTTTGSVTDDAFGKLKSRSLEPLTGLAMWSSEPQIIELIKGDRGLGFSILDYQDPLDPNDTLIVIRSLVPGGVAQMDGRLIPGDRLLFVNSINLENASLDQAVQALKGAPKGVVRIGVAKPLPMTDNSLKNANGGTAESVDASTKSGEVDSTNTSVSEGQSNATAPDLISSWRK